MRPAILKLLALLLLISITPLYAQDWAKARLEKSPRHSEWVPLKHDGRTVNAFVVYPQIKDKAPVIILIHEIFGLADWPREMADELAAAGYIVIAPDLLSGFGPNGGGFDSFASQGDAQKAVSMLNADTVNADLNAAADYAMTIPASNHKLFVTGYCWGGGKSFLFATKRKDLTGAFVFYGTPPPAADMANINAPVFGFYAGNDARVDATIPGAIDAMKAASKKYEPVTYEGAGHGFMRAGEDPTPPAGNNTSEMAAANKKARDEAFTRMTTLLKQLNSASKAAVVYPRSSHIAKATVVKLATAPECHATMQTAGSM